MEPLTKASIIAFLLSIAEVLVMRMFANGARSSFLDIDYELYRCCKMIANIAWCALVCTLLVGFILLFMAILIEM